MNLVCIKHPKYDGANSPVLSCKACCGIFIAAIKQRNAADRPQTEEAPIGAWLDEKAREATKKKQAPRTGANPQATL